MNKRLGMMGVVLALVCLGALAFYLGRQATKPQPSGVGQAWVNQAVAALDRAGVKVTLDDHVYSNTTIARAMYANALQRAMAAAPSAPGFPPVDLTPLVGPPNIVDARRAVAVVARDDLIGKESAHTTSLDAAKNAIFEMTGAPRIPSPPGFSNTQPPVPSRDPVTVDAQARALAAWTASAMKHHRFTTRGLEGLSSDDLPALIVTVPA